MMRTDLMRLGPRKTDQPVVFIMIGQPQCPPGLAADGDRGKQIMLDPKQLDDLAQRLARAIPKGIQTLQEDLGRNLRASLEAGLSRLDLVSREELDVQAAVLARTREKVRQLEFKVAELERALGDAGYGTEFRGG